MSIANRLAALALAALVAACGAANTRMNDPHLHVTLATATPGGGFPVYGAAFKTAIEQADPSITIETRYTRGSAENIPMLEGGRADLGLVQGEAAYEALAGIHRAGPANMKILWPMYSSPGMFVVRADSRYHTIQDLKGEPIAWGAKGSGLVLLAEYTLDPLGFDRDRDFKSIYLDRAGDGPAMVLEGRAAALWGGGLGWPGFAAMAESRSGARFIVPTPAEVDRITAKHTFLKRITIPAATYKGIDRDLASVGSWSFVFARSDLPDDTAYRLARALHRAEGRLAELLPAARESTAANAWRAAPDAALVHPGVVRYLREAGLAP